MNPYWESIFIRHFSRLLQRAPLRLIVHPFLLVQNRHKRTLDIVGEFGHLLFGLIVEILLDVLSADNEW